MTKTIRSIEIAAINITLHPHSPKKYVELLQRVSKQRTSASIRGEYHAMLGPIQEIEEGHPEMGLTGAIYKYFELDKKSKWFNVIRQKTAEAAERSQIRIPEELKPHFSMYYFVFFPKGHRIFFETKDAQSRLSPGAAAKMLTNAFERPSILKDFGPVAVTIEPNAESLDRILTMPKLRRLHIQVSRPNADDLAHANRRVMERLANMYAESETTELCAQPGKSLMPDEDTKTLAKVAQSNGHVEADGYNQNGKAIHESTKEHPLIHTAEYATDIETSKEVLVRSGTEMMATILKRERNAENEQ